MDHNQDALLRRSQRGDQEAFLALMSTWQCKLYALALQLVEDEGLAQEWLTQLNVDVYRRLAQCSSGKAFTIWLLQLTYAFFRQRYEEQFPGRHFACALAGCHKLIS